MDTHLWLEILHNSPGFLEDIAEKLNFKVEKIQEEIIKGEKSSFFKPSFKDNHKYVELSEAGKDYAECNGIDVIETECNPDDFFDWSEDAKGNPLRGRFISKRLGDYILKRIFIKTMGIRGVMYVYDHGCYRPNGEEILNNRIANILGEEYTIRRVTETISYIKTQTFSSRIDVEPNKLCLKNGIFDINTGKLTAHNPDIFTTTQLPIYYTEGQDCPKIKKFLSEIVKEDDIDIIQEIFGWLLWGDYSIQKAVMLIGGGGNGKSTLLKLVNKFLGEDNISSISLQDLTNNDFARSRLYGKLANTFADIPDQALKSTGNFKMLTGGDSMHANVKFKEGFDFVNKAKLLFSCNKLPIAYDDTDAFFRRWVFLIFPNKFEGKDKDINLLDKLITDEEMSGLLNWALEGLSRVMENKDFSNSESAEDIRQKYEHMSNPIQAFINERIELVTEGFVIKRELYQNYCDYCKVNKLPTTSENTFSRKFVQNMGSSINESQRTINGKKGVRVWGGIKILSNDTPDTGYTGFSFKPIPGKKKSIVLRGKTCVSRVACDSEREFFDYFHDLLGRTSKKTCVTRDRFVEHFGNGSEKIFQKIHDKLLEEGQIFEPTPGVIMRVW